MTIQNAFLFTRWSGVFCGKSLHDNGVAFPAEALWLHSLAIGVSVEGLVLPPPTCIDNKVTCPSLLQAIVCGL